jgi:hypothetical protein
LGLENVFLDVNSIAPGLDFVDVLTDQVSSCDALVAIIGRDWVSAVDKDQRRRLDNPNDFVRIEIEAALERTIPIIPVLVNGATLPKQEDLPESLKKLANLQWIEISSTRFNTDIKRLTHTLASLGLHQGARDQAERIAREDRVKRQAAEAAKKAEQSQQLAEAEAQQGTKARHTAEAVEPERSARKQPEEERNGAKRAGLSERGTRSRYYVSYARADGSDPNRERDVDRLCAEAQRRGISVLRDKNDLRLGELISDFMKQLGESDKVFVFLSDKYLQSTYCMFELFELWRNSKQNKAEFLRTFAYFLLTE